MSRMFGICKVLYMLGGLLIFYNAKFLKENSSGGKSSDNRFDNRFLICSAVLHFRRLATLPRERFFF
jgi:hypothetical protein